MIFLLQRFLNLRSQPSKNTIIGSCVIFAMLPLIHQGNVNQRHQRDCVLALTTLISLCIGIIAVGDELGCLTVILLVGTFHRHLYLFIVDVQPYM